MCLLLKKKTKKKNKKQKTHGLDFFHGNGPYGKIPTKKEPIRTLGFSLPYKIDLDRFFGFSATRSTVRNIVVYNHKSLLIVMSSSDRLWD